LLTLAFDLLLLLFHLTLSLLVLDLLVLHFVTNRIAAASAESTTDSSAGPRMTHGGANDRTGACAEQRAHASALLALG
jgi:hypothetical protein